MDPDSSTPIPRKVFLSSTCHDLPDERDALYAHLRSHGYDIIDSRGADFRVIPGLHSYDVCKSNIERSDIVVVVIGFRYGGIAQTHSENVSITREEYRHAIALSIPTIVFARREIEEERKVLKDICREQAKSDAAVFEELKEQTMWRTRDLKVFEFVEEITYSEKNNWISYYRNIRELIEGVDSRLKGVNEWVLRSKSIHNQAFLSLLDGEHREHAPIEEVDSTLDPLNGRSLMYLPQLSSRNLRDYVLLNPRLLDEAFGIWNRNIESVIQEGKKSLEYLARQRRPRFFISLDCQFERNNPRVWLDDARFSRYVEFTAASIRKSIGRHKFARVEVIFNPLRIIASDAHLCSLLAMINFHTMRGLTFGIIHHEVISGIPISFANGNGLLGERANVFCMPWGYAQVANKNRGATLVRKFSDMFEVVDSSCMSNDRGCYFSASITKKALTYALKSLQPRSSDVEE